MRFILALKCFFLVLFARRLPSEAAALLPESAAPPALLAAEAKPIERVVEVEKIVERVVEKPVERIVEAPRSAEATQADMARGAVAMLSVLQREGRLVDFLQEGIDSFSDDQIGAAVRNIHRDCRKALAEHVQLEPVMKEPDGATVKIEAGFDASRVRLTGNVTGSPPFMGALVHAGWRSAKVTLPTLAEGHDPMVIAPAEVEL